MSLVYEIQNSDDKFYRRKSMRAADEKKTYALSRCSSVQMSFFCGDVIPITSWAPDVVNLMHPYWNNVEARTSTTIVPL